MRMEHCQEKKQVIKHILTTHAAVSPQDGGRTGLQPLDQGLPAQNWQTWPSLPQEGPDHENPRNTGSFVKTHQMH